MNSVPEPALKRCLLDLHSRLSAREIHLVLGGGYGLFLKQIDLMTRDETTLLSVDAWPTPRTTNDLDLIVPLELLVDLENMQMVRSVLDDLQFQSIDGSEFWQFILPSSNVKIDLLAGAIPKYAESQLKMDSSDNRRVRPKGNIKLHARRNPEALGLAQHQEEVIVQGNLSDGSNYSGTIHIPSPFTYLMMKLTAFGDQVNNGEKDFGRHHALDVYRIVSMLTDDQYDVTRHQFNENGHEAPVQHVIKLTETMFDSNTSAGIVRLREHVFFGANMDIRAFIGGLQGLIKLDQTLLT